MRILFCISVFFFAAMVGCQSLSLSKHGQNEHDWFASEKSASSDMLGQAPAAIPPPIPTILPTPPTAVDSFSSTQYQPIQSQSIQYQPTSQPSQPAVQQPLPQQPVTQPIPALTDDPFLAATAPVSVMSGDIHPPLALETPIPETPQQAAATHRANDLPVAPEKPLHDPFVGVQTIPTEAVSSASDDPWGFGDPEAGIRNAVSIEEAAQKEETRRERARLEELAMQKPKDGTPEHLRPLEKWNGPFETRQKQETTEHDIIRQVSHVDMKSGYDNLPVYDWEKEREKGFDWEVLDPVNFFTKVRDWLGMGPDEKKANAAMKKGYDILEPLRNKTPDPKNAKQWLEAAEQFIEAAKRWPNSVVEEDALHLAGECYFFGDNYPEAMTAYQKLIINYQHSKHVDNAVRRLFRIARYWEKEDQRGVSFTNMSRKDRTRPTFDTFGNAKKAYETIFIHDPNGPISDDAVMALASAFLVKGRYKGDPNYDEAARYYTYLRENYPLSKHIVKAHEYEVIARTNAYMGAEHSSATLEEAGKLADRTLKQFGAELGTESKEEILVQKEEIIARQAEKEWVTGQFYDKKSYFGAARLQYEKILDQYPQTPFAERARERLEQIKHKPDQPDKFDFIKKFYMPRGTI